MRSKVRRILVAVLMAIGVLTTAVVTEGLEATPAAAYQVVEHRYTVYSGSYCYDVQIKAFWPEHLTTLNVYTFTGDCSQYIRHEIASQSHDYACYHRSGQFITVYAKEAVGNSGDCSGYNADENNLCTTAYVVGGSGGHGWKGFTNGGTGCPYNQYTGWFAYGPNALFGYHHPGPNPAWYLW